MGIRVEKLETKIAGLKKKLSKLEEERSKTLFQESEGNTVSPSSSELKAEVVSVRDEISDLDAQYEHAADFDQRYKVEVEHQEKLQALAGLQVEREKLEASAKRMVRSETNFKKGYGEYQESCGEVLRLLKIINPDIRTTASSQGERSEGW